MDNLLSTRQVANRLGVHIYTVLRYINQGRLKAVKIGGNESSNRHWRIRGSDLEAFINGHNAEPINTEMKQ